MCNSKQECVTQIEARSLVKIIHLGTCSATMAYVCTESAVYVTAFSTGSKVDPVSNFTELHILTQAGHS